MVVIRWRCFDRPISIINENLFGISVIHSLIMLYSTGIIVARGVQSELFAGVRLGSERLGGKGQRED